MSECGGHPPHFLKRIQGNYMSITSMWVDKYNPTTLDDYVFRDEQQKEIIMEWVANKSIPHLLLSGSPGVGKCLAGTELVEVIINHGSPLTLPISELFTRLGISDVEYDTPVESAQLVQIRTLSGYAPVRAFVKKHHQAAEYQLKSGKTIACSTHHLVFSQGVPTLIKDCQYVDTTDGADLILWSADIGEIDVYDVALDAPHQYVTPNGIIHHNTTLARVLFNELGINPLDILEINASRNNSVDDIRNKIINFVEMMPFGDFKVVLLDEADFLSANAQAALRGVTSEYSETARFVLTCNYPNRVIPALHSRCQGFHIESVDITEFTARVARILINEDVIFDLDTLDTFVKATYPDLRKCINQVQMCSRNGTLFVSDSADSAGSEYMIKMVELFKQGKISEARKVVCENARPEEIEDIYRWLYNNLEYLGRTETQQEQAILIIKQGLVDHALVIDPEINLAAVMIRLARNLANG